MLYQKQWLVPLNKRLNPLMMSSEKSRVNQACTTEIFSVNEWLVTWVKTGFKWGLARNSKQKMKLSKREKKGKDDEYLRKQVCQAGHKILFSIGDAFITGIVFKQLFTERNTEIKSLYKKIKIQYIKLFQLKKIKGQWSAKAFLQSRELIHIHSTQRYRQINRADTRINLILDIEFEIKPWYDSNWEKSSHI